MYVYEELFVCVILKHAYIHVQKCCRHMSVVCQKTLFCSVCLCVCDVKKILLVPTDKKTYARYVYVSLLHMYLNNFLFKNVTDRL